VLFCATVKAKIICAAGVLLACSIAWAQGRGDFHIGLIAHIKSLLVPTEVDPGQKATYLFTIQDGSDEYIGYYRVSAAAPDRSKELVPGNPVMYKISGDNVIVMGQEDKEIRAKLCKPTGLGTFQKCGNFAFSKADYP